MKKNLIDLLGRRKRLERCLCLACQAFIFAFAAILFLRPSVSFAKEPLEVRVAILKDVPEIVISVAGPVQIVDEKSKALLHSGKKGLPRSKVVLGEDGSFKVGQMVFKTDCLSFIGQRKAALTVNKRRFRGKISVYRNENNNFFVINTLDAESYIRGVLNQEISHQWPLDAIKAQAVAARTYVLYQRLMNKTRPYDVTADTSSQVYGGYLSERRKTNSAVNTTYGEALTYRGRIFETLFCANCGGITENASELWKINAEPLRGGCRCHFCSDSPHFQWRVKLGLKAIEEKLAGYSKNETGLTDIVVVERNNTGRVRQLELSYAQGRKAVISGKDFRALLGANTIRSTNFHITREGDKVVFSGYGWGHGVGLCQYGALGVAKKGYSYRRILEFYYPGAEVVKIY